MIGLIAHMRATCITEMDCGANGECKRGICECYKPWKGPECSSLALLPVERHVSGYRLNGTSSWGGSILADSSNASTHWMWAAEMMGHCGLKSWRRNSRIILAKSESAVGPYKFVKELWPVFSHEPAATRAPSGEFVVYFTSDHYGTGTPLPCVPATFNPPNTTAGDATVHPGGRVCLGVCGNGSTFVNGDQGKPLCQDNKTIEQSSLVRFPTVMSWAWHPEGPWSIPVVVYNGSDGSDWGGGSLGASG